MKNKSGKYIQWLPTVIAFLIAAVILIVIFATGIKVRITGWVALAASGVVVALITAVNIKFKLNMPLWCVFLICFHLITAMDLGTTLELYMLLDWWDLFVHGLFGLICSLVLLYLYLKIYGEYPNAFGIVSILLMTLGIAAFWELYEFVAGSVIGEDMQNVEECINAGLSPLFDTMTDIAIAIVGVAVFYIAYFIDKKTGRRLFKLHG